MSRTLAIDLAAEPTGRQDTATPPYIDIDARGSSESAASSYMNERLGTDASQRDLKPW